MEVQIVSSWLETLSSTEWSPPRGGGGGDRPSGARGWEDRSYGARDNAGEGNAYDEGRSRRRRGSSSGGGDDYSGYGGAEG